MAEGPILVTGAAGFIGFHVARRLLDDGRDVVGLDNLNAYYDPTLKEARRAELAKVESLPLRQARSRRSRRHGRARSRSIAFPTWCISRHRPACAIRWSIRTPMSIPTSPASPTILEGCRHNGCRHLLYASSSSVYGSNTKMPFSVHDNVDHPLSLYGASKKANELMAHAYAHLFGLPTTGLAILHGLWAVGPARHGDVDFCQGDHSPANRSNFSTTATCGATSPMSTMWSNRSCG